MTSADTRIVGNYTLRALIGSGGTSRVYAAEHRFLGEPAAVKLLRSELAGDAADAFVEEAARTRAIDHANVVQVLDCGRDPETGCFYIVMERLEGGTLGARLDHEGPLDEAEVRRLGIAIAEGMAAVHAGGIVHRDLKPANVMLTRGGEPKIVDFGIAKHLGGGTAVKTSRRVGTPAYMAPEQLTGGMIAPSVDVWALGVILFEAATGKLPFVVADGACPQLFVTAPRAGVSPALDDLIARCLEREPGRRFASMTEVIRALRDGPSDRITEDAGPISVPAAPRRASRRVWWLAGAGAAAAVAAIAVVAGATGDGPAEVATPVPEVVQPVPQPGPDAPEPTQSEPTQPEPTPPQTQAGIGGRPVRPVTWTIDVRSHPSGATIVIDGSPRGTTPMTLHVRPRAALELRLVRHRTERLRIRRPGPIAIELKENLD